MSQILVGVFNSFEEADQAVMRLEQSGIARSDMEVHASSLAGDTTGTPLAPEPLALPIVRPFPIGPSLTLAKAWA